MPEQMKKSLVVLVLLACAAQAQTGEQSLEAIDLDQDGALSREEFGQFRVASAFANDGDQDGSLSLDEFRSMLPSRLPRAMHGRAFARIDRNGDGSIQPNEIEAMPARAFEDADADGDGRLVGDELRRFASASRGG